jgi:hypothetical protein
MNGNIQQINVENIPNLLEEANAQLSAIAKHAIENPLVKGKRTLTIKVSIEPKFNSLTEENYPVTTLKVTHSVPASELPMVIGYVDKGTIRINAKDPLGPADVQMVIPGTGSPERVQIAR